MRKMSIAALALVIGTSALAGCGRDASADVSAEVAKIDQQSGPAREQALYAKAKDEGSVTWYTGLIPNQVVIPIKEAFEKKYPGVELKYYRGGSSEIAQKMLLEAKARAPKSDVWDGAHAGEALKGARAAEKYDSPYAEDYPNDQKDPDGYWTAVNIYVKGIAYNTDRVKPADAPKTFDDLLDPKWKGQVAWTPEATGGADFIGNVLNTLGEQQGEEFLRKLAGQKLKVVQVSSRELLNQAIAGQYPIVLQVFNNHVALSKKDGSHVAFSALNAASKELNPLGLTAGAAHPFAARLLIDFLLSPEGQAVFRDAAYIPASPDVRPTDPDLDPESGRFKTTLLSPAQIEKDSGRWMDLFDKVNAG
ncbi:extracellular solute-binding protein [Micromonospora sp. 4G57]|uniref:Extracellular solute-binding protein n=1 Tax=Micromonospora sicca TaxID=2202420 RepID=A0ABU5JE18_9ACTN|nr:MULTISPECIES: extracellular solute-binding protein [unclassified Micromonospora]MDZ5445050.1 extracellular solute-binding protein [Micromonospora sp. 4G57]MDZ5490830.1 extracellular solute-binding protein [Micromonospora sp. 4G53]